MGADKARRQSRPFDVCHNLSRMPYVEQPADIDGRVPILTMICRVYRKLQKLRPSPSSSSSSSSSSSCNPAAFTARRCSLAPDKRWDEPMTYCATLTTQHMRVCKGLELAACIRVRSIPAAMPHDKLSQVPRVSCVSAVSNVYVACPVNE